MSGPADALLSMRGVHKRFGAVHALSEVDLEVRAGEVHALIGENGAGKSTLMKVLAGVHRPDAGEIRLGGRRFAPDGPLAARRDGIAMVYQELNLASDLTVAENIALGREPRRAGFVLRREMAQQATEAMAALGHPELTPDLRVATLSTANRQLVEIGRALAFDARIVVMDEPTSSLAQADAEHLFEVVGRLRDRGIAVIYISHFLEEVQRVADRYTVLRDGRSVDTGDLDGTSLDHIIAQMIGRELSEVFPKSHHEPGEVVLSLEGLSGKPLPDGVTLELRRGEIFGIAGLVGAGRSELLRAVFGLDAATSGRVKVGSLVDAGASPWTRLAQGIGLLSEDRKQEGLALELSIADNTTLSRLGPVSRWGFIDRRKQRAASQHWVKALSIRLADVRDPVNTLSGGNQQKVALSRLLHHDVDVLLLDEPTRGVDVGSKVEIYRVMGELASQGKAIVFVSSYLPELMGVCDRLAVMHRGKLGPPRPIADWNEAAVMQEATSGAAS